MFEKKSLSLAKSILTEPTISVPPYDPEANNAESLATPPPAVERLVRLEIAALQQVDGSK